MHPVKGFGKHLLLHAPSPEGIELVRVHHAARDVDELVRTRLDQVGQGAPLIPHEEAVRHIEARLRGERPDHPEAAPAAVVSSGPVGPANRSPSAVPCRAVPCRALLTRSETGTTRRHEA